VPKFEIEESFSCPIHALPVVIALDNHLLDGFVAGE